MYILASWGRFYVSISDHFGTPKIAKFAPWCSPFQFGTIYSRRFNISLFPFHFPSHTPVWIFITIWTLAILFYIFSFLFLISFNFHLIVHWLFLLLNIVQRASFVSIECESHCKEATVPMFQCFDTFVVANNPLVANSSCLPALPIVLKSHVDLFANHFWICSLAVWAFVPNRLWAWVLIGRADLPHSRPHICCSVGSIFLNGQGLAAPSAHL